MTITPLKFADAALSTRHVFVRDLMVDCFIGIYDNEKSAPQKVRINIDLAVQEDTGPHQDKISNVVCYEKVVNDVKTIINNGHVQLVETLSEQIADMCLIDARVKSCRVRVEKLDAIPDTTSVGIEIERYRK